MCKVVLYRNRKAEDAVSSVKAARMPLQCPLEIVQYIPRVPCPVVQSVHMLELIVSGAIEWRMESQIPLKRHISQLGRSATQAPTETKSCDSSESSRCRCRHKWQKEITLNKAFLRIASFLLSLDSSCLFCKAERRSAILLPSTKTSEGKSARRASSMPVK